MKDRKQYFSMNTGESGSVIYIYGDITSWEWDESDVSSYTLSKAIDGITSPELHVYINSYGGEVAEGLAIYNALKRSPARVVTHADGFVCSAAMLPYLAGEERVMSAASLLMVHNAWTSAQGNAEELRKTADDLDAITQATINAYMTVFRQDESALKALMDAESWILPGDALELGLATAIVGEPDSRKASQSVKQKVRNILIQFAGAGKPHTPPAAKEEPPKENKIIRFLEALSK